MPISRTSRRALMGATALAGALSMFAAGAARAESAAVQFDQPSQSLASALRAYSATADQEIIFADRLVAGRTAPELKGAYTAEGALMALLDGTGLSVRRTESGVLLVEKVDQNPQGGSAAGDGAEVEALIVTAQKREEDIQDVPIAISAFTQETLERSQVAGGPDLMTQVPNMTFTKTNFSSYSIQLRGIGTQAISATVDPAVAVAFNNTPFIRNRFFEQEFYDLQRVEVLRGPQGTLYGRNATAGVVNLISQKARLDTYEAKLSADVANYNSTRLEGMINVPLVDDVVALRVAGAWTKREGYATNELKGEPIDGRDLWSTRVSLRFAPNDRIDANLIWEHFEEDDDRIRSGKQLCKTDVVTNLAGFDTSDFYQKIDDNSFGVFVQGSFSQGCAPASLYSPDSFQKTNALALPYYVPLGAILLPIATTTGNATGLPLDPYASRTQSSDLRVIEAQVDPSYRAKSDVAELQLSIDLTDSLTLNSETAWASDFIFSTQDYNRFAGAPNAWQMNLADTNSRIYQERGILNAQGQFCDPQIGCSDRLTAMDLSTARSQQFSQELRLASDYDGPFNFSLGANFLRYDTEDKYYVFINSISMLSAYLINGLSAPPNVPYIANVTDNSECLARGMREPDYYRAQPIARCTYIDPNPITSLNDLGHNYFLSKNPFKLISYAVFGEAYYNIAENLKVTAGLRWTVDKKEAPFIPSWIFAASTVGHPVVETVRQEWREPTGRLAIDWQPDLSFTDDTMLYAAYSHGYKAGGMNPPPYGKTLYGVGLNPNSQNDLSDALNRASATHPKTFEAEFVDAFEIGAKNTLLDGALTVNLAGFYYDYQGYQLSQIVNRAAVTHNFDADVWGIEVESDWRPVENLRLGLKLGYQQTRVADGMRAIDVMDRTSGNDGWVLVRPFPTLPTNCVLPAWLLVGNDPLFGGNPELVSVGGVSGGSPGGCENAYLLGHDPGAAAPFTLYPYRMSGTQPGEKHRENINYAAWSTNPADYPCWPTGAGAPGSGNEYPGADPACLAALSNNGEGFFKDLSGNELPNAPNLTATITADYTIPLPSDWLMTLHTDLYYQSEAWTRIFNTEGYDKLKAYTNVNLAAIFTNEDLGWKVMAYVKNVFDRDSITGAFLNSDDTGLTTNIFLTEPRLFGLRVTKDFQGGPWWTGANPSSKGPFPLTVELGGQIQRHDAPYSHLTASWLADPTVADSVLFETFDPRAVQGRDLDTGDGREVKLTWRPDGSPWKASLGMRYGRVNNDTTRSHAQSPGPRSCRFKYDIFLGQLSCNPTYSYNGGPPGAYYTPAFWSGPANWADASARSREEHDLIDFAVGLDVGLGILGGASSVSAGIRYGDFQSATQATMATTPDWVVPDGWVKYESSASRFVAELDADREFKGFGPTLFWDGSAAILGGDGTGHLNLDWSLGGGVLFGKQKTAITGFEQLGELSGNYGYFPEVFPMDDPTPVELRRSKSTTVPLLDLSLGVSYDVGRIKIGTGYRWERYFDVLDVGHDERQEADRTIDGPYFKLAVGFDG